jgi:hypothetical protein
MGCLVPLESWGFVLRTQGNDDNRTMEMAGPLSRTIVHGGTSCALCGMEVADELPVGMQKA